MYAHNDQAVAAIRLRPRADVGLGAQPVDAGEGPEVHQDDVAAQLRRPERGRADPLDRAVERGHLQVVGADAHRLSASYGGADPRARRPPGNAPWSPVGVPVRRRRLRAASRGARASSGVPIATIVSPAASTVSPGGCGWNAAPRRKPDDHRAAADVADVWPSPAQRSPTSISSMPVVDVHIHHAAQMAVHREPRHLGAAGLVGRDHAVGARPA